MAAGRRGVEMRIRVEGCGASVRRVGDAGGQLVGGQLVVLLLQQLLLLPLLPAAAVVVVVAAGAGTAADQGIRVCMAEK